MLTIMHSIKEQKWWCSECTTWVGKVYVGSGAWFNSYIHSIQALGYQEFSYKYKGIHDGRFWLFLVGNETHSNNSSLWHSKQAVQINFMINFSHTIHWTWSWDTKKRKVTNFEDRFWQVLLFVHLGTFNFNLKYHF